LCASIVYEYMYDNLLAEYNHIVLVCVRSYV